MNVASNMLTTSFLLRAFDMMMLAKSRGREREEAEWSEILKKADERFSIVSQRRLGAKGDFGPFTGVMEVVFNQSRD